MVEHRRRTSVVTYFCSAGLSERFSIGDQSSYNPVLIYSLSTVRRILRALLGGMTLELNGGRSEVANSLGEFIMVESLLVALLLVGIISIIGTILLALLPTPTPQVKTIIWGVIGIICLIILLSAVLHPNGITLQGIL